MNALIVLYSGPQLEDVTISAIAAQMVNTGIDSNNIDVYNIDQSDIVKIVTQEVIRKNCTNEQRFVITPEVEETPLHHAYVYLHGIFGQDVENNPNVIRFITTCLAKLQNGDERLKNALDIIMGHERYEAQAEGLPPVIYKAIQQLSTSNLI